MRDLSQRQVALDVSLWPLSNVLTSESPCFQLLPWALEGRGGGCAEDERGSYPWHYTHSPSRGGNVTPMDPRGTSSGEGTGVVGVIPASARHVAGQSLSVLICEMGMRIHPSLPGCYEG